MQGNCCCHTRFGRSKWPPRQQGHFRLRSPQLAAWCSQQPAAIPRHSACFHTIQQLSKLDGRCCWQVRHHRHQQHQCQHGSRPVPLLPGGGHIHRHPCRRTTWQVQGHAGLGGRPTGAAADGEKVRRGLPVLASRFTACCSCVIHVPCTCLHCCITGGCAGMGLGLGVPTGGAASKVKH